MEQLQKQRKKNTQNEACMQEHLFDNFKSKGHSGFLGNVSIILIDKTDGKVLKGEKITG